MEGKDLHVSSHKSDDGVYITIHIDGVSFKVNPTDAMWISDMIDDELQNVQKFHTTETKKRV